MAQNLLPRLLSKIGGPYAHDTHPKQGPDIGLVFVLILSIDSRLPHIVTSKLFTKNRFQAILALVPNHNTSPDFSRVVDYTVGLILYHPPLPSPKLPGPKILYRGSTKNTFALSHKSHIELCTAKEMALFTNTSKANPICLELAQCLIET